MRDHLQFPSGRGAVSTVLNAADKIAAEHQALEEIRGLADTDDDAIPTSRIRDALTRHGLTGSPQLHQP